MGRIELTLFTQGLDTPSLALNVEGFRGFRGVEKLSVWRLGAVAWVGSYHISFGMAVGGDGMVRFLPKLGVSGGGSYRWHVDRHMLFYTFRCMMNDFEHRSRVQCNGGLPADGVLCLGPMTRPCMPINLAKTYVLRPYCIIVGVLTHSPSDDDQQGRDVVQEREHEGHGRSWCTGEVHIVTREAINTKDHSYRKPMG
jgi:hypothetical protein